MTKEDKKRCGVCVIPYFERNNYFYGKLMTVRDFFKEQCYFNEKRWLINRMISGWGVVCGLDVKQKSVDPNDPCKGYDNKKVVVTPGLAIDCCGREILVCEEREISVIPEKPECHQEQQKERKQQHEQQREPQGGGVKEPERYIICLEYHECKTEPVNLPPIACDQKERSEFNRIRDGFKIYAKPESECEQPLCGKKCPLENKSITINEYLCNKLKEGCPECPDCPCVILATVTVDDKGNIDLDTCSQRKLVYNNQLLYELIDCYHGDLPHIIGINWPKPFDGSMKWATFENIMEKEGLQVTFDRDMKADTLNDKTFLFCVKHMDPDTGYYEYKYIPPESIVYGSGLKKATFEVNKRWLKDVFEGFSAIQNGAEFTVILRGDHIMDVDNKRALDGKFIGGRLPSGNGTQGGDFVSWFFVGPKPADETESKKGKK